MPSWRKIVIEDGLPRLRLTSIPAVYTVSVGMAMACPLAVLKTTSWWAEAADGNGEGYMDGVPEHDDAGNALYAVFLNAHARSECLQLDIYQGMRCVLNANPRYKRKARHNDTPARVEVRVCDYTIRKDARCAWVYFALVDADDESSDSDADGDE